MRVDVDVDELRQLAKSQRSVMAELTPQLERTLTTKARAVAARARAEAPKDRPWLGTTDGIVVRKNMALRRTIISPRDPEGQSVGYRVEYGTSEQPPRPFLGPALVEQRDSFNSEMMAALVKASL